MEARNDGVAVIKVLIVDDDEEASAQLARGLQLRRCSVAIASNGVEAIAAAKLEMPSLALLDLVLGRESGLDLIRPLLELSPEMRIIVLSGMHETPAIVEAVKRGAVTYLTKPRSADEILHYAAVAREKHIDPRKPIATREEADREHILRALTITGWNVSLTSELLGIERRSLQRIIDRYRLTGPGARDPSDSEEP